MIRFEEKLQLQSTESWAIQEDVDKGGVGQVAVQVEEGTPGQHFWKCLMEDLFSELGLFGFQWTQ